MEDQIPDTSSTDPWAKDFTGSVREQRQRAREFLGRQREQFDQIEQQLLAKLNEFVQDCAARQAEAVASGEIAASAAKTADMAATEQQARIEQLMMQLGEAQEQAESQHTAAQVALSQARADQEELRQQLSQSRKQLNNRAEELNELREQISDLTNRLAAASDGSAAPVDTDALEQISELREERRVLLDRLSEAEAKLEQRPAVSEGDGESDDLRRRFELAVEDVRELKQKNAELQEELAEAQRNASVLSPIEAPGGGLDWEAQKRQMLQQLESDFDEDDEEEVADKLTAEGTIRITDQVVEQKEREIAALKQQIEQARSETAAAETGMIETGESEGGVAVGAAAISEMLDSDELIKQERENLKRLQDQWREKLRQSEIDISVERAQIARERAEMKESLERLESQEDSDQDTEGKPKRGRWLSRLGLKDSE